MRNTVDISTKSDIINFIIFKRRLKQQLLMFKRAMLVVLCVIALALCLYHKNKFITVATVVCTTISKVINEVFIIKVNKVSLKLEPQSILDENEINAIVQKISNHSFNRKKMQAIASEVKKDNPVIEDIIVRRIVATGEMIISVKEKKILAIFIQENDNENGKYSKKMITSDNKIVPYHNIKNVEQVIKIYGYYNETIDFQNIMKYLMKYKLTEKLSYLRFYKSGRFDFMLKNGLLVKLPRKNWKKAIMKFVRIDGDYLLSSDSGNLVYIDLRTEDKIIANLK